MKFNLTLKQIDALIRECADDSCVSTTLPIQEEKEALLSYYTRPSLRDVAKAEADAIDYYVEEINELLTASFDYASSPLLKVPPLDYRALFTHRRRAYVWALCTCLAEGQTKPGMVKMLDEHIRTWATKVAEQMLHDHE